MKSLRSSILIAVSCLLWGTACSPPSSNSAESNPSVPLDSPKVASSPSPEPQSPTPQAQTLVSVPPRKVTTFECVSTDKGWATIARRDKRTSPDPLFVWNSTYFGADWTPEKRCNTVSGRLTKMVADNSGRLENLDLTYGIINVKGVEYTVICAANRDNQESCTESNTLVTLSPQNAQDPGAVLVAITNFGQGSSVPSINEKGKRQFIPLETLIDKILPGY